jgi:hypothetical protein
LPKCYAVYQKVEDIDLSALPDVFVLKPTDLAAANGVLILHRITGDDGFWDAMGQRRWSGEEIIANYRSIAANVFANAPENDNRFIAEERIVAESGGAIPIDYKFHVFDGVVRLILQIDRNVRPTGYWFYDRDFSSWNWTDHLSLTSDKIQTTAPLVPSSAGRMLEMAADISRRLANPFVRVDLFAARQGPLVGELTHRPGGPYRWSRWRPSAAYDSSLAEEWKAAANRLGVAIPAINDGETIPIDSRPISRPSRRRRP